MLLSRQCKADGKTLTRAFERSQLWRQRGVPHLVPCMPRSNFRNWAHEVGAAGKGNLGHLERTFWNSGRAVYQELVFATISGMKLSAQDRCQLRDWSLWDDEPACAVMNMYMNNLSGVPNLLYAGTT